MCKRCAHYLLISKFFLKMKKLNGMKSFSSLENKKLESENLEGVSGGRAQERFSEVTSNFLNADGARDYDMYVGGRFVGRGWDTSNCEISHY
ncbi:TIGR04139 family peptide modification target [Sphingobacterium spiritivorum]